MRLFFLRFHQQLSKPLAHRFNVPQFNHDTVYFAAVLPVLLQRD